MHAATWPTAAHQQHSDCLLLQLKCCSPGLAACRGQFQHIARQTKGGSASWKHKPNTARLCGLQAARLLLSVGAVDVHLIGT